MQDSSITQTPAHNKDKTIYADPKRLQVTPAADLAICIQEAKHIVAGLDKTMHTGHLLLSFFTVPGPAEILLEEKNLNEDKIIAIMQRDMSEKAW